MTDLSAASILYEDAHLIAVAKPAGLLTQGNARGEVSLEDLVRRHIAPADPQAAYLGTIHRLDRPVSGVVLWAKTARAARRVSQDFTARRVVKTYWAVVETPGPSVPPPESVWADWLTRHSDEGGVVRVVPEGAPEARQALTRMRVEPTARRSEGSCWLSLRPETGRTHQLRAQAAARGWPVWGDRVYGSTHAFPEGIALHARTLSFRHPSLGRTMTVVAPLPASWAEQGWEAPG